MKQWGPVLGNPLEQGNLRSPGQMKEWGGVVFDNLPLASHEWMDGLYAKEIHFNSSGIFAYICPGKRPGPDLLQPLQRVEELSNKGNICNPLLVSDAKKRRSLILRNPFSG